MINRVILGKPLKIDFEKPRGFETEKFIVALNSGYIITQKIKNCTDKTLKLSGLMSGAPFGSRL